MLVMMKFVTSMILIASFFFSPCSFSQSEKMKKISYIRIGELRLTSIDPKVQDQIKKNIITLILLKEGHELLFGDVSNDVASGIDILEVQFEAKNAGGESSDTYTLEAILYEPSSSKALAVRTQAGVVENAIVYQSSLLLEALFKVDFTALLEASREDKDRNNETRNERLERLRKEKRELLEKEKREAEKQQSLSNDPTLDPAIKNEQAEKKTKNVASKAVSISNFSSPDIDLSKMPPTPIGDGANKKPVGFFSYSIAYGNENLQSANIIEVTNELSYLGLRVEFDYFTDGIESNHFQLSSNVRKPMTDSEFEFSTRFNFSLSYNLTALSSVAYPFLGLSLETSSFVNLGPIGEGLRLWSTQTLWSFMGGTLDFKRLGVATSVSFYIGKSFIASTDYTSNTAKTGLDGQFIGVTLTQKIWRFLSLYASYKEVELSSQALQGLENASKEFSLGFRVW